MRTEKYQIRNHPQNKRLGNMLDDLGDVHNHSLALEKRYYRIYGKYAGRYRLQPHLTKLLQRTKQHWVWIPRDTLDERFSNWWRAVRELARLYRKVANQRRDWHWKLATDLCRRFDAVATETLNLDAMKRLWGRKVFDLAFGEFLEILKFKCLKHNREFHQVGQWTPTSKPCSDCGYHNEKLSLSDRQWTCPECGSHHDRDINAAINILRGCLGPPVEQM